MGKPSQLRRRIQRENYVGAASNWSISIYLMWEHLKLKSIHFFQSCFQCLSNLSGCLKSKCVVYHLFTFTTSYLFVLKIVGQEEMLLWYSGRILFLCTTFVLIIMTSKHFWLHQCIWLQTYLCSQSFCDHIQCTMGKCTSGVQPNFLAFLQLFYYLKIIKMLISQPNLNGFVFCKKNT